MKTLIIFTLLFVGLFTQTAMAQSDKTIDKATFIKAA